MTAIFITATGADVGKTFVAASLIGHFRQMGRVVEVIKPVVSGFDPTQPAAGTPPDQLNSLRADYRRAMVACLEGRGYSAR